MEVQMFLYALEANDANEELAWELFQRFQKNRQEWQKAKKIYGVEVESNEDGNGKVKVDDKDGDAILYFQ